MERQRAMGEFDLIAWIREAEESRLRSRRSRLATNCVTRKGIGDDCAIMGLTAPADLLVTTDMLMDGRHFHLAQDGAEAVGFKALGVNLSDIAAMAGVPIAAVVAVALPKLHRAEIAQGLHKGMTRMAEPFQVELIGGDTNAWDGPLVVSVTVFGKATDRGAALRSGARPGDAIFVTGPLGGSLLGRHLSPSPRILEALALKEAIEIHAMIDISDGLSSDLGHILEESGNLGATLDEAAIPIHADARRMSAQDGISPLQHALNDGEDFELCVVLSPDDAGRLMAIRPPMLQLHRVGEITSHPGIQLRHADGRLEPIVPRGFDHFRQAT